MTNFSGRVKAIYLNVGREAPLQAVEQVEAAAGRGLIGDRHSAREGEVKPLEQVTLIEAEALEAALREYQVELSPERTRRNLLTEGVPLNHLVGQRFRVGQAVLRGIELCEPCGHLEKLTLAGVRKSLVHRGGLRAEVLEGGPIQVGAAITPAT